MLNRTPCRLRGGAATLVGQAQSLAPQLQGLPTGTYLLRITQPGHLGVRQDVTVSGGVMRPAFSLLYGDVTGDAAVTLNDLAALAGRWRKAEPSIYLLDLDGDGRITLIEMARAARNASNP